PELKTSITCGSHEKGASAPSKNVAHPSTTCCLPRRGSAGPKKIASSEMKDANASWSRSAIVCAKARSAANTSSRVSTAACATTGVAEANRNVAATATDKSFDIEYLWRQL